MAGGRTKSIHIQGLGNSKQKVQYLAHSVDTAYDVVEVNAARCSKLLRQPMECVLQKSPRISVGLSEQEYKDLQVIAEKHRVSLGPVDV